MEVSSADDDLMEICINYKGVDVTVVVPLEEANILMNDEFPHTNTVIICKIEIKTNMKMIIFYLLIDEAVAAKYAEAVLANQRPEISHHFPISKQLTDKFNTREATLLFLSLRTQYNDKFNDKKTQKNSLWQLIAAEMKNNG